MGLRLLPKVTHGRRWFPLRLPYLSSTSFFLQAANSTSSLCAIVLEATVISFVHVVDCNELEALCEDSDPSGTGASSWTSWLAAASLSFHYITDSMKPVSTIFGLPAGDGLRAKEIVSALSIEGPTDLLIQTTDARASS